jgi:hypothetical protein
MRHHELKTRAGGAGNINKGERNRLVAIRYAALSGL